MDRRITERSITDSILRVLEALLQGGKIMKTAAGFDFVGGDQTFHIVKTPEGYDLTGPGVAIRILRVEEDYSLVTTALDRPQSDQDGKSERPLLKVEKRRRRSWRR